MWRQSAQVCCASALLSASPPPSALSPSSNYAGEFSACEEPQRFCCAPSPYTPDELKQGLNLWSEISCYGGPRGRGFLLGFLHPEEEVFHGSSPLPEFGVFFARGAPRHSPFAAADSLSPATPASFGSRGEYRWFICSFQENHSFWVGFLCVG